MRKVLNGQVFGRNAQFLAGNEERPRCGPTETVEPPVGMTTKNKNRNKGKSEKAKEKAKTKSKKQKQEEEQRQEATILSTSGWACCADCKAANP
jgi:hypothetical protein